MADTLAALTRHLEILPSVRILSTKRTSNLAVEKIRSSTYAHVTDLAVVPSIDGFPGLFDARYLNYMLDSLVPEDVKPTELVHFEDGYALKTPIPSVFGWVKPTSYLWMGRITFEEQIGFIKGVERHTITDPELKKTEGFDADGVREVELTARPLNGLIRVTLWPNAPIANEAEEHQDWGLKIPVSALKRFY